MGARKALGIIFMLFMNYSSNLARGQEALNCEPITSSNIDSLTALSTLSVDNAIHIDLISGDRILVSTSHAIYVYGLADLTIPIQAYRTENDVWDMVASRGDSFVAFGHSHLQLWNLEDDSVQTLFERVAEFPDLGLGRKAISPADDRLAVVINDEVIQVWDLASGTQLDMEYQSNNDVGWRLLYNPTGTVLATSDRYALTTLEANTLTPIQHFDVSQHFEGSPRLADIAYSPDGSILAAIITSVGGPFAEIAFLDSETLQIYGVYPYANGGRLSFSPNGDFLAVGVRNEVYLWRFQDQTHLSAEQEPLVALSGHISQPIEIEFSDDMRFMASLSNYIGTEEVDDNGTIIIWGICN
jgi:WD40 repeat protein